MGLRTTLVRSSLIWRDIWPRTGEPDRFRH
jgi:hypothetical protein